MNDAPRSTPSSTALVVVLAVWLAVALWAGAAGAVAALPLPAPAFAIVLALAALLAVRLWPALGGAVAALGMRGLVGLHLVRIVAGANFLRLANAGVLPGEFALVAGWGDIAVGVGAALVLWLCLPLRTAGQRAGLLVWNVLGLIDILGVLGNGARMLAADPAAGVPFAELPLTLLPLFVVPLVIASHVLIFARLAQMRRERSVASGVVA